MSAGSRLWIHSEGSNFHRKSGKDSISFTSLTSDEVLLSPMLFAWMCCYELNAKKWKGRRDFIYLNKQHLSHRWIRSFIQCLIEIVSKIKLVMTEPRNYELGKSIKTRLLKLGRLRSLSVGFHELFVPRSAPLITLCMLERYELISPPRWKRSTKARGSSVETSGRALFHIWANG